MYSLLIGRFAKKVRERREEKNQQYIIDQNGQKIYVDARGREIPPPSTDPQAGQNQSVPQIPQNGSSTSNYTPAAYQNNQAQNYQRINENQPHSFEPPPSYAAAVGEPASSYPRMT